MLCKLLIRLVSISPLHFPNIFPFGHGILPTATLGGLCLALNYIWAALMSVQWFGCTLQSVLLFACDVPSEAQITPREHRVWQCQYVFLFHISKARK